MRVAGHLNLFYYAALVDTQLGVICTDLLGDFEVCLVQRTQYMFVCYVYEPNAILVQFMTSHTDKSMVAVYDEICDYLETYDFKQN